MKSAVILGTGPSLADCADHLRELHRRGRVMLFGLNDTFRDFDLDVWIACDPKWHQVRGRIDLPGVDQWHWDAGICERFGYRHIEGRWFDGLSTDPSWIAYGHSSGWQALNLAMHYYTWGSHQGPIYLCGYDMTYRDNEPRHYFKGLSEAEGEYEPALRKWSLFDKPDKSGLLYDYKHIADQQARGELPCRIVNATPRSAMRWFPFEDLPA